MTTLFALLLAAQVHAAAPTISGSYTNQAACDVAGETLPDGLIRVVEGVPNRDSFADQPYDAILFQGPTTFVPSVSLAISRDSHFQYGGAWYQEGAYSPDKSSFVEQRFETDTNGQLQKTAEVKVVRTAYELSIAVNNVVVCRLLPN